MLGRWTRVVAALLCVAQPGAWAQSNYASHANDVAYIGDGLPDSATLDGKVTKLDDLSSVIFLNRTKGTLNCGAGSMQVELKFNEPFFGIAYADFDRNSACQVAGKGAISYSLELPLKGCGTKQDPQRVFTNNIVVRFHPGLEMDGDEIITIVCRYPPPVAPPPIVPLPILEPVAPVPVVEPPLKGFHILLIICAILFLSLLLLGLGCSYICLKKRNVTVVRRHPFSSAGTGSEITKLSGSSLGNISMFEGLKIPRAHAAATATGSTSGSETALIIQGSGEHSDTLPSDYPSESPSSAHSEVEDVDTRSLRRPSIVSSAGSYENKAYVHQEATSSFYSEGYGQHTEAEMTAATAVASVVPKPPIAVPVPPPEPKFDVSVRVKRAPPPPPTPTPPPSEVESTMSTQARNLTTILEREEMQRSFEDIPKPTTTTFTYVPELHPPPPPAKYAQTPPVYSRILRRQQEQLQTREAADTLSQRSIPDNDNWSQGEDLIDAPQRRMSITSARSLTSLNTEMTDTRSMTEIVDNTHKRYAPVSTSIAPPPPPPPPIVPSTHYTSEIEDQINTIELLEPPVVVSRRPEITSHVVDDVFLRTITEKRTIEDIERHRRQVTEYHTRPQPPPNPKWDVVIRNYPAPNTQEATEGNDPGPDWESYSEASSVSGYPTTPIAERHQAHVDIERNYLSTLEVPPQDPPIPNWDVLIRVLNPPPVEELQPQAPSNEVFREEAVLTIEDREKWRQIITTESTLRTLLTEATVREDYERIRKDQRYEKLFEPKKWDVIIRVLAPPEKPSYDQRGGPSNPRYRRKTDWDTRSRRSSLPTLYEYDSDGGSSVRTLVPDVVPPPGTSGQPGMDPALRSRRTSRSSLRSDMDVRSMTEVMVDFARPDVADTLSDASGPSSYYRPGGPRRFYDDDDLLLITGHGTASEDEDYGGRGLETGSLVRSVSQPSLARSASEFTEHWVAPGRRHWDAGDLSSPEHSPRSARSRTSTAMSSVSQHQVLPPGSQVLFSRTTTTMRESYQQQGWFGDADSEASFK
ncbi:uncharacterized protein pot isoform X2 [Periplaneta americana]|uniref:uncharacterized protein pot isoform X2 n=1 Tax=Periplaneta americana TaxID=6978 RepID=UPI0037E8B63B